VPGTTALTWSDPVTNLPTCPRCLHHIPNDLTPGARQGAQSRVAPGVEICSACGTHEAFLPVAGAEVPALNLWPITVPWAVTTPHSHIRVLRCLGFEVSATKDLERQLRRGEAEVQRRAVAAAAQNPSR
jgi:hypothetical protein